ncbi:MAG: DNA repair exonuclease [Hydrogenothermaceae bacterium]|nr:DNA repair exonuclease [Hydrogenothermaceae bacterium]
MKFIHLSDTHLGYQHLGLTERKQDFTEAFSYVVDYAIENSVDFIIHTGDFFHSSRPSNEIIIEAIQLVKKLKDNRIPIFTIHGNHDRGSGTRDRSALDILKEFGLTLLDSNFYTLEDINIFGIKYIHSIFLKRVDLKSILEKLYEEAPRKEFNMLMLHFEFSPFFKTDLEIESVLPECFEYVGVGHFHQAQESYRVKNSVVVYPGSTEYTQFNERDYSQKGFYLIHIEHIKSINSQFVPIPSRKFIVKRFNDDSLESRIEELRSLEFNESKKPVLILKGATKGNLSKKNVVQLLENRGLKSEFLHISVDLERIGLEYEFKYLDHIEKTQSYVEEILQKNIEDVQVREKVRQVLYAIHSFENLQEFEVYIEENKELFQL